MLKPKNRQFTESECVDVAVMCGCTKQEGLLYFLRYESRGWLDGTGNPITNISTHIRLLKVTGGLPARKEDTQKQGLRKMPVLMGKVCSEKENDRLCGLPAVFYRADLTYPYHQCAKHISEKTKQAFRDQGYDV